MQVARFELGKVRDQLRSGPSLGGRERFDLRDQFLVSEPRK